jgi:hypothetical protein
MSSVDEGHGWLLVTVSTAGAPASLRVHVWRKLRGLGALYLQQSVCLLPDLPQVARQVRRLLDRVDHDGGTGRVLHIRLADAAERDQVIAEFQAARDGEYEEVLERLPEFFAELERETARGRATYAEVEENEADLMRYRDWMSKIAARDYFEAPRGQVARAELARAEEVFATFEAAALAAEEPGTGSGGQVPGRLRAVRGES